MSSEPLILASGSPRRKALLAEAGYRFETVVPDDAVECGMCSSEGPAALVASLAYRKAADVAQRVEQGWIVAADTVAECGGQILGKPTDRDHAEQMLRHLSGREHRVLTGLCVWPVPLGQADIRVDSTSLVMDRLTEEQLHNYLDSHDWEGKAGAFGYQDGLDWITILKGSQSNVVGLPMELLDQMLAEAGYRKP